MKSRFQSAAALVASAIECDLASLVADSAMAHHPQWDSISHLNVMMLLEEEFGIAIDDVTIERFSRLDAIEALFQTEA